jgi:ribonuclease-3
VSDGSDNSDSPDDAERADALDRLEAALGYRFDRRALLENALIHSSYAHEQSTSDAGAVVNNERLEFLGDSVLGLAVAHALYRAKPDWREGDLSRALHALVEGRSLSKLGRSFELGSLIRLGRTEQQSGGEDKPSILENAMEAVIGAVYLDGGLDAVSALVERVFGEALTADAAPVRRDPKTEFQERVMATEGEFPRYRVVNDSLVEGDERRFTVEVVVRENALARGVGRTKRSAERLAAAAALEKWEAQASVES